MRLDAFWKALGSPAGQGQILAEWRSCSGDEFGRVRHFLRPTERVAQSFPCPHPGGEGCPREVIHHSADHIVAACRDVPPSCDLVRLEKTDLILHELDLGGFCRELATALGLAGQPVQEGRRTWSLGTLHSSQHGILPVWLGIPVRESSFSEEVLWVLNRVSEPFILLTPRVEAITTDLRALVISKKGQLFGLGGILEVNDQGRLAPTDSLESILWPSASPVDDEGLPEAMIRKVGRDWEFTYESKAIVLPDWLGVRYLVELLRGRREPISARELFAAVKGIDPQTLYADGFSQDTDMESDREALHKLRTDRAQAENEGNFVWLKEIDEGVQFFEQKFASQKDRRGRRRPDDEGEKCRKAVSKAVHRALGEIKRGHPALFEHLKKAVSLGFDCWYHPQKPVNWQFR